MNKIKINHFNKRKTGMISNINQNVIKIHTINTIKAFVTM